MSDIPGTIRPVEIMAKREAWSDGISLYARQVVSHVHVKFAKPVQWEVVEDVGDVIDPMMTLKIDAAQQLMDELWRCGLRPTEGTGSAGSLAATQAHLKDMREIAFDLLRRPTQIFREPGGVAYTMKQP